MAVGGAAYLVSKAIRTSRVVAFGELGMEAIYEFDVKDMPVTVAVDAQRHVGAQHRAGRMVGEDPHAEDPGARGLSARWPKSTRCVASSSSGIRSAASWCTSGRRGRP